ncbi:hypothetical protein ACFCV3_41675 [Kribbella sp. NPDC056345]|uniref:hypothetical protein n=1 Tax=Kribbella sp. NPDC056345 TaxID=3345789 RepID=UPI0035D8FF75
MEVRFLVRRNDTGAYAVYDSLAGTWCTPGRTGRESEAQLAADLNQLAGRVGNRLGAVRIPPEPIPVEKVTWVPAGTIDVWIRDVLPSDRAAGQQWLARLTNEHGHSEWVRGKDLRPDS